MTVGRTDVVLAAWHLQNTYAHAIDTRDWELFRSAFTPGVQVHTDHGSFDGLDAWLDFFIPFHDECGWTLHVMTNHHVTERPDNVRATCYGDIRWTHRAQPDTFKRATSLYQDTLSEIDGSWRISERRFDVLLTETINPVPAHLTLWTSVLDAAGGSRQWGGSHTDEASCARRHPAVDRRSADRTDRLRRDATIRSERNGAAL